MKKLLVLILMAMMVPASAMAMKGMSHMDGDNKMDMDHDHDHEHDGKKMDHGSMAKDGVIMLQDEVVDGVKGAAHIMTMKGGMGKMLMVMFTDAKSGDMITKGRVAVKIETPDEKVSAAMKMKKGKGMFGVYVNVEQKGVYHFKLGTKLADGEKRAFHFHYEK